MRIPPRAGAAALVLAALIPATAVAKEPAITVPQSKLAAAFHCHGAIDSAASEPVMLVTGTGATGEEAYLLAQPALDVSEPPGYDVGFPAFTTGYVQVSGQRRVYGIREEARRAGRRIAIAGISQGG